MKLLDRIFGTRVVTTTSYVDFIKGTPIVRDDIVIKHYGRKGNLLSVDNKTKYHLPVAAD